MKPSGSALQRDTVVREALALLNEVGIDGVTTRKLAERLGIKSASLYWHFKNKRDLLDAMAEAMLGNADETIPGPGLDWRDWLAREAKGFRKALLSHRDGALVHVGTRPEAQDYPEQERAARFLVEAGFSPDDALRAQVAMSYFVVGWVLEEQAAAEARRGRGEKTPLPDPKTFPTLSAARRVLRQEDPDADFEFGLTALIAGLALKRR